MPDLAGYCQATGGGQPRLRRSATGRNAATDNWQCANGNDRRPLPIDAACVRQFGAGALARANDPDNAMSWVCLA